MRLKGLIQFFTIALVLVSLFQLSFTWQVNRVEKKAQAFAEKKVLHGVSMETAIGNSAQKLLLQDSLTQAIRQVKGGFLDSLQGENIYNLGIAKYTYLKCKERELKLGLDLKGGMDVVLQVGAADLIRAMADNSKDKTFNRALDSATKQQVKQTNKDYVTLFYEELMKIDKNYSLASIFSTQQNHGKIKNSDDNATVLEVIKKESAEAFDRTYNILKKRIDKFGVSQPSVTAQPAFGRIVVELPGVDNQQRVNNLLQSAAKLEFWETWENKEILPLLDKADAELGKRYNLSAGIDTTKSDSNNAATSAGGKLADKNAAKLDTHKNASSKALAASSEELKREQEHPLRTIFAFNIDQNAKSDADIPKGPMVGYALAKDTAKITKMLNEEYVKNILPHNCRLLWGAKPIEGTRNGQNLFYLYAIKTRLNEATAPLEGDHVTEARSDFDQNNKPEITMRMDAEGARTWASLTGANVGHSIAIVLDNYVQSAPNVENPITGGNSSITGSFTVEEAKDLATVLQTGKLPAPARIIAENVVGPSLGAESIRAGIISVLVAILCVIVFMVIYYNNSGYIADIALFFNLLFTVGVLASFSYTLTMPGIAGIVLSLAIAVDANVIIHERIKEELRRGMGLAKAIADGHTKSYSALFDANLTTLITGFILAYFGLGPVKGFAVTLNIGIILTLFTSIFLAHIIYDWALKRNKKIQFTTKISHNNFANANYDFVGLRKKAYLFSGTLAVIGLISIFWQGFDYGVDFKGGRSYQVRFSHNVNTTEISKDVAAAMNRETPVVKTIGSNTQVKITTAFMSEVQTTAANDEVMNRLYKALAKQCAPGTTLEQFKTTYLRSSSIVGPTISNDIKTSAIKAIIYALMAIFLFILIRFRKWQYSLGAIISLAHDVLMVMGIYSLLWRFMPFALEVDETFVAAVLTVMGYSMNDTVIVYDRIREYLRDHPGGDMKKLINDAINNTLNRTVITSATVFLVLLILFLFGGDSIRGFTFAMLIGIVFGTYSSIFVATPIVVDLSPEGRDKAPVIAGGSTRKPATAK